MPDPTPIIQADDRPPPHRGWDPPTVGGEPLDTIQQRLFAISLRLGIASGDSADASTAAELRRLEDLVAELIKDVRALARPSPAAAAAERETGDGDPQGRREVRRRA